MEKSHSKYLFLGIFILIAILSFLVIKPFITSILLSIVLAYLFYPIYKILIKKFNETFSAILILIIVILLFIVPMFFIIENLVRESIDVYDIVKNSSFGPFLDNTIDNSLKYITIEAQSLIKSIPKFLINIFITLFLFYYFIKEGNNIIKSVKNLLPLEKKHKEIVVNEFKRVTSAVVYGLILIGLVVGILAGIGFYIFKVPNPMLWGLIVIIVSMLPGIGTSIIWIPASIIKLAQGDYFNGVGLFLFGLIFISGFEMFFKPKLISYKSDIHPGLIVLGVFGGIALLGFIGIFFGPLILITFITFLKHLINKN